MTCPACHRPLAGPTGGHSGNCFVGCEGRDATEALLDCTRAQLTAALTAISDALAGPRAVSNCDFSSPTADDVLRMAKRLRGRFDETRDQLAAVTFKLRETEIKAFNLGADLDAAKADAARLAELIEPFAKAAPSRDHGAGRTPAIGLVSITYADLWAFRDALAAHKEQS